MDFRSGTDALFKRITHDDLAKALGVSVASIRQARLRADAESHRAPPVEWRDAILSLAQQRVKYLLQLIERVEHDKETVSKL